MKYGFFSSKASERYGFLAYRTATGEVEAVTYVTEDPEGAAYGWEDKVAVGEVVGGPIERFDGTSLLQWWWS